MSRKKTHLDEFAAMAKLYDILKPFDQPAVERMWIAVEEKLKADRPKPRVRRKAGPLQMVGTIDISKSEVVMLDSSGNVIQ